MLSQTYLVNRIVIAPACPNAATVSGILSFVAIIYRRKDRSHNRTDRRNDHSHSQYKSGIQTQNGAVNKDFFFRILLKEDLIYE